MEDEQGGRVIETIGLIQDHAVVAQQNAVRVASLEVAEPLQGDGALTTVASVSRSIARALSTLFATALAVGVGVACDEGVDPAPGPEDSQSVEEAETLETPETLEDIDYCDFTRIASADEARALRSACVRGIDGVTELVEGQTSPWHEPAQFDVSDIDTELLDIMRESIAPAPLAHGVNDHCMPAGTPMPDVDTSDEPCDLPPEEIDMPAGVGGINNCTDEEEARLENEVIPRLKFMTWRARQAIQFVLETDDPGIRAQRWQQGDDFSLETWFGEYDEDRIILVQDGIDHIWDTIHGDWKNGVNMHIQCWHPLSVWQVLGLILTNQHHVVWYKHIINPCFYDADSTAAHTGFTWSAGLTTGALKYPVASLEVCERFFNAGPDDEELWLNDRASLLGHEVMHHRRNSINRLWRDNHNNDTADEVCDGGWTGNHCYSQNDCMELATEVPHVAVQNNSNFEHYLRHIGSVYLDGCCDTHHNPLCFPSECCGNGVHEQDEGEQCDGDDVDGLECLADYGLSEGTVECTAICTLDPQCDGRCGNEMIDPALDEECDGPVFEQEWDCLEDFGLTEGFVSCSSRCRINSSTCFGICGNGMIDPADGEECDGDDFGSKSCGTEGYDLGNLACTAGCQVDTSGCSGGKEGSIPDGYETCGVSEDDCDGTPEGCWDAADAGQCLGGPCQRTSGDRVEGQLDPESLFHPKGNFRDADDYVYVCEPIDGHETTCVDDEGWGVCMKCGINEGETMLGCSCQADQQCDEGGEALVCFGGEFPGGGYCWPNSGPPWWQCDKGACGQDLRDGTETNGQPNAEDGGSYCEHFPDGNQRARCEPQRCGDIQAQVCAGAGQFGLVCDLDDGCIEECEDNLDCQFNNWPQGYHCQGNRCVP